MGQICIHFHSDENFLDTILPFFSCLQNTANAPWMPYLTAEAPPGGWAAVFYPKKGKACELQCYVTDRKLYNKQHARASAI